MTTRGCHLARARGLSDAGHPGSCVSWMGGGNSLGILFSLGWRRGSGHEAGWLGKLSHFVYDRVISKAVSVCSSPFLSVFKHFPLLSQSPACSCTPHRNQCREGLWLLGLTFSGRALLIYYC